jgi:type III secretion system (T3SS) SseB-like protein
VSGGDAYARDGLAGPVLAGPVLVALSRSRLLVPVVATPGEVGRGADIAAVLMQGRDGRRGLLAFTGLTALQAWNHEARPVPVTTADAARSAIGKQAAALVVDVAGPAMFVVETSRPRAAGRRERADRDFPRRRLARGWVDDQIAPTTPSRGCD